MRYVDMGRTRFSCSVMCHSSMMKGMAILGSELPMVLLTTSTMMEITSGAFLDCDIRQRPGAEMRW